MSDELETRVELATRVESVEGGASGDAPVDAPSYVEASASLSASLSASIGGVIDRIGRYVLIERLGRGAFGMVWAAYDPQLDRRVAIKLVHARQHEREPDPANEELLSEAQLLAQLSHPNVVAIHDVGRIEDVLDAEAAGPRGGVFIVMEYLGGPTLAQWLAGSHAEIASPSYSLPVSHTHLPSKSFAAASSASLRPEPSASEAPQSRAKGRVPTRELSEILRVFTAAGRGLQAAHARDLVHLDFKPANVMFGDDGRARVLDFGLARVRRRGLDDSKQRKYVAGTPAYMAPEQHARKPTDARADQYAFCVVLWEAIYGERPFDGKTVKDFFRAKYEGPPELPASRIRHPHIHAALLRGLSFSADERFATMQELLEVLADDPRLRRRRTIAGVALVAGLLGAGFGLARASDTSDEVVEDPCELPADTFTEVWDGPRQARAQAAFEATGVPTAAEAFTTVSSELEHLTQRWTQTRAGVCRAALVEGSSSVEQMSEELLCLDRQLRAIAGVGEALTRADAELVARGSDALAQLEAPEGCKLDEDSPDSSIGQERRAALLELEDSLTRARLGTEIGHYDAGISAAEQAIGQAEALGDDPGRARAQRERGLMLRERGDLGPGREASLAGLAAARRAGLDTLEDTLLDDLLMTYTTAGEFAQAAAIRELLAAHVDPERDPAFAHQVHLSAAVFHERQQHWDEAIAELEAARAIALPDAELPARQRAKLEINFGNVFVGSARDLERAEAHYRNASEILGQAYGRYHPLLAKIRINLGVIHLRNGDTASAIVSLEAALDILDRIYGGEHPYTSRCLQNLAGLHSQRGNFRKAVTYAERSVASGAQTLGREHPDYATSERTLAALLMLTGEHQRALERFEHAASVYARSYEPSDTRRMGVAAELAEAYWWLGDAARAREQIALASQIMSTAESSDTRRVSVYSVRSLLHLEDGDATAALADAEALQAALSAVTGPDQPDMARAHVQLASALRALGELERAEATLDRAQAILMKPGAPAHPFAWEALLERAHIEHARGELDAAKASLDTALMQVSGPEGTPAFARHIQAQRALLELG